MHFIVSVSETIYTITKFEWPYYTCETKDRVDNRKKGNGKWKVKLLALQCQRVKEDAIYVYKIWLG